MDAGHESKGGEAAKRGLMEILLQNGLFIASRYGNKNKLIHENSISWNWWGF